MALIQVGSTLYADGTSSGVTMIAYGCDGCEAKTGDRYTCTTWVDRQPDGEWDNSGVEGWMFVSDDFGERSYCPHCAAAFPEWFRE
jgi:hypothetical protein